MASFFEIIEKEPALQVEFDRRVSYALLSLESQDPALTDPLYQTHFSRPILPDPNPRLRTTIRDCCVYILVTVILVILNANVRFDTDTPTSPEKLIDAAQFLFPSANASSPARKKSAMYVEGREDIRSFGFDLGGSTCACELKWDAYQYWQRVFYGTKYVTFHCATVFFGVLCLHRPQWVILWKVLNEVLEEIGMPLVGKFAWTVSVFNMESKYDTLINDLLLAVVPFCALGLHVVSVLKLKDPIQNPTKFDKVYLLQFTSIFLQYNMFNVANQSNNWVGRIEWTFGDFVCKARMLTACIVQLLLIWLLFMLNNLSLKSARAVTVFVCVFWAPFIVYRVGYDDEQISAILSFSLAGISVCCYQWYLGVYSRLLMILLPCYALALWVWWDFESILAPPADRFYYHSLWCGMSASQSTSRSWFSCAS